MSVARMFEARMFGIRTSVVRMFPSARLDVGKNMWHLGSFGMEQEGHWVGPSVVAPLATVGADFVVVVVVQV